MSPESPLTALLAVLAALAATALLARGFGAPSGGGRTATIDGMRGYLALFVFLHHSSIWFNYLRADTWGAPASHLFLHFGKSSVAMFFMITGFLFFGKLLDARGRGLDWWTLFVARAMRLVPLYLFSMALLFLFIALVSHGHLNEPLPQLLRGALRWLAFTLTDAPDLNGVHDTFAMNAGVSWSLPYEWFFYLCLPALALLVGVVPPLPWLITGLFGLVALTIWVPHAHYLVNFVAGAAAALVVRKAAFRTLAGSHLGSGLALGLVTFVVLVFPDAHSVPAMLLLGMAFALIAGGSSLFGVLEWRVSRLLGEIAYSIYLLHGLLLFAVFSFVLGRPTAASLSPFQHALLIVGLVPVLILLCFLTYQTIEAPAMRNAKGLAARLRSRRTALSSSDLRV
jgi:peptidoglycan/LPS O-acetylase OafA/YrhL